MGSRMVSSFSSSLVKKNNNSWCWWGLQQWRGIRVKVQNNNLERALAIMQRQMQSSGVERLIKSEVTHHIKNSEKRVLAKKNLHRKIRSIHFANKLQSILITKLRGN